MVKKGFTIIETVVSLFLFSISFSTILTTILLTKKANQKEQEKTVFQSILYEIDTYLTRYGKEWDKEYITEEYIIQKEDSRLVYYDPDFKKTTSEQERTYILEYTYRKPDENTHLYLSVYDQKEKYLYENIDYGYRRIQK